MVVSVCSLVSNAAILPCGAFASPGTFCFTTNSSWNTNSRLRQHSLQEEMRDDARVRCMGTGNRVTREARKQSNLAFLRHS